MELKTLSKEAIPGALEKAEQYRLLNEPGGAESICLDVLKVERDNQRALVTLLLALSDQFGRYYRVSDITIKEVLGRITSPYQRAYYSGLTAERKAKAALKADVLEAKSIAYDLLREAMDRYEEAEKIRPPGNDEPLLRWNTCVRIIERNKLSAEPDKSGEGVTMLE